MIYHKYDMKDNNIKDLEGLVRRAKPKVKMDDAMAARLLGDLYGAGAAKRPSYRRWWCGGAAACAALLLGLWWGFSSDEGELVAAADTSLYTERTEAPIAFLDGKGPLLQVRLERLGKSYEHPFITVGAGYHQGGNAEYHIDPLLNFSISLHEGVL